MQLAAFKDLTRFEQTFFGLPFVLSGALLSIELTPFRWGFLLLILLCFLLARISGMAFNQLIDRHLDAQNPRTENRAIPAGRVTPRQARVVAWGALILFVLFAMRINFTTAILTPIATALLLLYSYMKRIHATCHFVLGAIHFLGATMAYAAIGNSVSMAAICLGGVAACLIIGTDIAYAIQDYAFDCRHHLFSLPSRLGIKNSLNIAAVFHLFSLFFLLGVGLFAHLTYLYYLTIPIVGFIFLYFHRLVWRELKLVGSLQGIESSFFICNVAVSFTVLALMSISYYHAI